jgi:hypothetical protein
VAHRADTAKRIDRYGLVVAGLGLLGLATGIGLTVVWLFWLSLGLFGLGALAFFASASLADALGDSAPPEAAEVKGRRPQVRAHG